MSIEMTMQLVSRRVWPGGGVSDYIAICPGCGREYLVSGKHQEGCADFVDVICMACDKEIGRLRDDVGGNKLLTIGDALA